MRSSKVKVLMNAAKYITLIFIIIVSVLIPLKVADRLIGKDLHIEKIVAAAPFARSLILRDMEPNYDQNWTPSDAYMRNAENLEQKPYRIRTDENGFILGPDDFSRAHGAEKVDIIFFGGSTTECGYVDEEFRFPYLVSKKIKHTNGASVISLNGGVSGNHAVHSLLYFIGKGIPEKPSYIVLMHAINDLVILSKTKSYWNAPKTRSIIQTLNISPVENDLRTLQSSSADNFISKQIRRRFPNIWFKISQLSSSQESLENAVADEWAPFRDDSASSEVLKEILISEFSSAIRSSVSLARAWGIEPILMTQFNRINEDDEFVRRQYESWKQPISYTDFVVLYKMSNDIIRSIASAEGVHLIDLDRELNGSRKLMYDSVHLNSEGSKLVADIISKSLSRKFDFKYEASSD